MHGATGGGGGEGNGGSGGGGCGGNGGGSGGIGGGGSQRALSPANIRFRPVQVPLPLYDTVYVASMKPRRGLKKNCTPRLACSSVNAVGSVGLPTRSSSSPGCVPVNVRVSSFTKTVDKTSLPDDERSGVLKYSYAGTVSCSKALPSGLVSRSKTVIVASACSGRIKTWWMSLHE